MKKYLFIPIILLLLIGIGFFILQSPEVIQKEVQIDSINDGQVIQRVLELPKYENKDLTAVFTDKNTKENILRFELKSHKSVDEILKVGVGRQVVMYYDVDSSYLLKDVLKKPIFIDMRTGKVVERDYRYVYWGEEEYENPIYEIQKVTAKNGTISDKYVQTGTEILKMEKWLSYNSKDITQGKIRIGIEVDVKLEDYVDGIWDIGGLEITKHASWRTTGVAVVYNNSVNISGARQIFTFSSRNLGVEHSTRKIVIGTHGLGIGTGTNDISSVTVAGVSASKVITSTSSGTGTTIGLWAVDLPTGTTGDIVVTFSRNMDFAGLGVWAIYNAGNVYNYSSSRLPTNAPSMKLNFAQNGGGIAYTAISGDAAPYGTITWTGMTKRFDGLCGGTTHLHSGADNETSAQHLGKTITATYSQTTDFRGLVGATWEYLLPPEVTVSLLYPPNTKNFTTSTNNFNGTAVSKFNNLRIMNVSLLINGSVVSTNTSGYNGTYTFTRTLPDGNHNWTITAWGNDSTQYNAKNGTLTFSIDSTPEFTVNLPTNNSNHTTRSISFDIISTQDLSTLIINYNGTNRTISTSLGTFSWHGSLDIEDGNHELIIYGRNEDTGVLGIFDENWLFNVDTIKPQFTINYPILLDYKKVGDVIELNWSVTDTNLNKCWYNYNGTNITLGTCTSGTNNLANITLTTKKNVTFYANDTIGNLNSTIHSWNYRVFENARTFTPSIFETASETYRINITANSSLTAIRLNWNDINYTMSESGGLWTYSRDMPIGTGDFNLSFLFAYAGNTISSDISSQEVNLTFFSPLNATYTTPFLNVTFKDENSLANINVSVPTSTFVYYLGSGTVNKTLTYVNNVDNFNHTFAGTTRGLPLKVLPEFQYRRVSDYPQRIWQPTLRTYNSTMTTQVLYSLNTNDGIFVTYQVLDTIESPIEGVEVVATRIVSGTTIQVGAGTTDSAGTVTFWMNPDFQHTVTFTKEGYDEFIFIHFPTQNAYTITLGGRITPTPICSQGITSSIRPLGGFLWRNNIYNFNYTVTSDYWNLTGMQFTLTDTNGTVIGSASSSNSSGATISVNNVNVSDNSTINMAYFYEIDSSEDDGACGQITGTRVWITQTEEGTEYSVWYLAQQFDLYVSTGLWGLDSFGRSLIVLAIILLTVGSLSRRYGLASEPALMGILFSVVFLLDVGLNFIPRIVIGDFQAMENFLTYITFIILVAVIIREEQR